MLFNFLIAVLYVRCCRLISRAQTHELQQCLRIGYAACILLGRLHIRRFGSCRQAEGHGTNRGHFRIADSLPARTLYHTHLPPPRTRIRNSRVPANKETRLCVQPAWTILHIFIIFCVTSYVTCINSSTGCDDDYEYDNARLVEIE